MIESMIYDYNISIPIVPIKDKLYLIGIHRITCEIKRTSVLARIGGGYQDLTQYILSNHRYFQRMLVVYMIKSGNSLEWVVDQLI